MGAERRRRRQAHRLPAQEAAVFGGGRGGKGQLEAGQPQEEAELQLIHRVPRQKGSGGGRRRGVVVEKAAVFQPQKSAELHLLLGKHRREGAGRKGSSQLLLQRNGQQRRLGASVPRPGR